MQMEALTFRAESEFIDAIRTHAAKLGVSVNQVLREIIAPFVGYSRSTRRSACPHNDLMRFCGCLKDVDCRMLEGAQAAFSKIEPDMWK